MLAQLESRIAELLKAVEQSLANHNAILGALQEARNIYNNFKALETDVKAIENPSTTDPEQPAQ